MTYQFLPCIFSNQQFYLPKLWPAAQTWPQLRQASPASATGFAFHHSHSLEQQSEISPPTRSPTHHRSTASAVLYLITQRRTINYETKHSILCAVRQGRIQSSLLNFSVNIQLLWYAKQNVMNNMTHRISTDM